MACLCGIAILAIELDPILAAEGGDLALMNCN